MTLQCGRLTQRPATSLPQPCRRRPRTHTATEYTTGQDHDEVHGQLIRLLPLKTKAEYEPGDIAKAVADKAVERARRCVAVAQRLVAPPC